MAASSALPSVSLIAASSVFCSSPICATVWSISGLKCASTSGWPADLATAIRRSTFSCVFSIHSSARLACRSIASVASMSLCVRTRQTYEIATISSSSASTEPKPSVSRLAILKLLRFIRRPVSFSLRARVCGGSAARMCSVPRAPHQAADIQNQRDAAIAHDGGARHVVDLAVVGFEVLHDDLLLAEQLVDQQRDAAALGFDDDHDSGHVLEVEARHLEHVFEPDDRHVLVAHFDDAA